MKELALSEYIRKPFTVSAVQITDENLQDVADWCQGEVRKTAEGSEFIKVKVQRPQSSRQTRGFAGDWVLYSSKMKIKTYKVYTNKAFEASFELTTTGLEPDLSLGRFQDPSTWVKADPA